MSDENLWSQNALAHEFDMDRRTVKVRLKGIRPAGYRHGYPVYRMRDVAHLLKAGATRPPSNSERREELVQMFGEAGADLIEATRDPISVGVFIAARRLMSETPSVVVGLAMDYGLSMEQLYGVFMSATAGMFSLSLDMLKETDIPRDILEDQSLALWPWPQEPVWERIAELLGTTFDRDACQIYHLNAVAAAQAEANP
jgi:hypothetical protein